MHGDFDLFFASCVVVLHLILDRYRYVGPFVILTTFNTQFEPTTLQEYLWWSLIPIPWFPPILHVSKRIWKAFRPLPLIAFSHLSNLRDFLVWGALTWMPHEPPGNYSCGAPRYWWPQTSFFSHTTENLFKVKTRAYCKYSNVIYFITWRRCGQQYVGETAQWFHLMVNGHWFDIVHRRTDEFPVSEHFSSGPHTLADTSVMVIKHAHSENSSG